MEEQDRVRPPVHLSNRSKAIWNQYVRRNRSDPGLGRQAVLLTALEALDRGTRARLQLDGEELVFETEATGARHINPLTRVERDSMLIFAKLAKQIGLDCY